MGADQPLSDQVQHVFLWQPGGLLFTPFEIHTGGPHTQAYTFSFFLFL